MAGQLRIACIGGESTGKTSLATALNASVNGVLVAECLREFVQTHGRAPRMEEQRALLEAQRAREQQISDANPTAAVIMCDPATLMIAIYSELYFNDRSLDVTALEYAHDYDALLWCRPDIPWVPEPGQHDGPEFRARADELLEQWVELHGGQLEVLVITGTHGRIALAHELLKASLGSVWQPDATSQPT